MSEPVIRVLEKQDFEELEGSILNQEVPLPALNPTNFVISRKDPSVVFVATLGTLICRSNESRLPKEVVEEERKKRGFDSQLVVQKVLVTKDKELVVQLKTSHRFDMQTNYYEEHADKATLKESADGTSLIFVYNNRTLLFDSRTLQLTHNFSRRVHDIMGNTVLQ